MAARPHFFIVGAAKCGTTALFQYLSRHRSVFMPAIKEPNFFCTDLKSLGGIRTLDEYQSLFAGASPECITGEASCLYLYSKIAVERIMAHNPDAKIIVMLRYPVDASHSLYAARWGYGHENMPDFEHAWRVQADRLEGRHLPSRWPEPATLQYGAMYRYAEQVRRVLAHVPEKQRHLIVYEDFFAAPERHFAKTLEFLNLAPDPRATFSVVNSAVGPRSISLDRLLRGPPRWLTGAYSLVRPLMHAVGVNPAKILWKVNSVPRQKTPMRQEFREQLDRYFAGDIRELEQLVGRRMW